MLFCCQRATPDLSMTQNIVVISSGMAIRLDMTHWAHVSTTLSLQTRYHNHLISNGAMSLLAPLFAHGHTYLKWSHQLMLTGSKPSWWITQIKYLCSLCAMLCIMGFWPWAETGKDKYPTTSDHPNCPPQSDRHLNFIAMQFREEEACSRFSASFGHDLLPGMYSVPVHAVLKPRSKKLHMVMDHSAGSPSLNNMINHDVIVMWDVLL